MKLFSVDSPFVRVMEMAFDIVLLNLLFLLCCVPIVTIGASLTALHTMTRHIVLKEDTPVIRGFFSAFRENCKEATLCWLPLLLALAVLWLDGAFLAQSGAGGVFMQVILVFFAILCLLEVLYVFPLVSHYKNTVRGHLKNGLLLSIRQFPKTVMLAATVVIPVLLALYGPVEAFVVIATMLIFFGCSGIALMQEMVFTKLFAEYDGTEHVRPDGED